ncbi:hypothetical protein INR49_011871 [Caranx melampygus]|nr:hypothetical protein INR49_011871 [Caranx melampygus]
MAVFGKAMADGLLLTLSLALLVWGVEGEGNGRGMREVSGTATVYLGQDRDIWRPLIHTTVNLSDISSIRSTFQFRTFDPEGVIFYGDTKNGEDWFVLSLKDGIPLMQIRKEGMLVSAAGGTNLNDGKWHTLDVSNHGKFVILKVDGAGGLVVGMQSIQTEEEISGALRLALGGIMIDKEKMIVQFEPQMDACVREGSWLNMSVPWETEAEELWPCFQNIQPGSYFPGSGFAIFNTSGDGGDSVGSHFLKGCVKKIQMAAELHPRSGKLIGLSNSNRTARRNQPVQEFNHGLVLSKEPLRDRDVFTVRIDKKHTALHSTCHGAQEEHQMKEEKEEADGDNVFQNDIDQFCGIQFCFLSGTEVEGREPGDHSFLGEMTWVNSWSGSIEIGVTALDPAALDFPSSATGLKGGSWIVSGCSVLRDGRSVLEEYGRDLDQLAEGDRVGIQRSSRGELHLWVNGQDCGAAAMPELSCGHNRPDKFPNNLEPDTGGGGGAGGGAGGGDSGNTNNSPASNGGVVGPGALTGGMTTNDALLFHEKCGTLIKLSNNNKTAERRRPLDEFNNGVVMTNRPLRHNEMFEIRIDKLVDKWSGSIEIGVTTHNPNNLDYPATMTNLRSGTIMMSGCGILTNGKGTRREYCEFSLDELQEGDHIGLMRKASGALHFYINGIDQGVAAAQTPGVVYGVVDLYGMAVKVTIVHNHNHSDRLRRNNAIMRALSPDVGRPRPALSLTPDPEGPDRLLFHPNCGQKAAIISDGRTALRPHATDDFNHGVVLSSRPLRSNEVFQVRIDKMVDKWAGSIEIGVTTHNPAYLQLPSTMTNLRSGTWMMTGNGVMHNGTTILDEYGHNLDRLKAGDTVGVVRKEDGSLHFFVNGVAQGPAAWNVPPSVYAVVDLYGQAAQATIMDDMVDLPPLPEDSSEGPTAMSPGSPCSVAGATTTSDLRFHQLHGTNAVITNGGRTALRQNCRSEFNDAIVISNRCLRDGELFEIVIQKMVDRWSGSIEAGVTAIRPEELEFPNTMTDIDYDTWMLSGTAIMQDGNTMRNNYGCDLDSLTTGSRIGMMRSASGDLHYYINGVDQGMACSGLPPEVYAVIDLYVAGVAHRLHSKHGKNVVLLGEGCQAIRVGGYAHGIVFSAKELKADELFEVRIDEVDEQWCGSLHIGLTTLAPPELPSCPLSGLSPSLPHLRTKVTWLLCGSEVRRNGVLQRQNYGCSLDRLTVGNRVGVKRCSDDTMHIYIDGEDMGPAATAVAKVHTHSVSHTDLHTHTHTHLQ